MSVWGARTGRHRAGSRGSLRRGLRGEAPAGGRRRRSQLWRGVRILLALTALGVGGWGGMAAYDRARPMLSEWFEIRYVSVTGIHQLDREDVLQHLGLRPGETLFSVDPEDISTRLTSHAWVRHVEVRRVPLHTLSVHVMERQPAAVLKTPSRDLLLDEEGYVLSVSEGGDIPEVPVLVGIEPNGLMRGDPRSREAVRAGIEVAGLIGEVFRGPSEVHAGNLSNMIASVGGLRFLLGPAPFDEKWDLYRRIRPTLHATENPGTGIVAKDIDLRYPNKVIVRERG